MIRNPLCWVRVWGFLNFLWEPNARIQGLRDSGLVSYQVGFLSKGLRPCRRSSLPLHTVLLSGPKVAVTDYTVLAVTDAVTYAVTDAVTDAASGCWRLLAAAGGCWRLPAAAGGCRRLLAAVGGAGGCWRLLSAAGGC